MELLCKNGKFSEEQMIVFNKYNIKLPKEGYIYELLRVVKYPRIGKTGLIVAPLQNQFIEGEIAGIKGKNEVSFDKERFTTLMNDEITEEMLKQFKEEQKVKQKGLLIKRFDSNNPYLN